jgi:hypothetical protein
MRKWRLAKAALKRPKRGQEYPTLSQKRGYAAAQR